MACNKLPLRKGHPFTVSLLPLDRILSSQWSYNLNNKTQCEPCLCCWAQGSWMYLQQLRNCTNGFVFLFSLRNLNPSSSVAWKDTTWWLFWWIISHELSFSPSEFILKSGSALFACELHPDKKKGGRKKQPKNQLFIQQREKKGFQVCLGEEQERNSRTIIGLYLFKLVQGISSTFDGFLFLTWCLNEAKISLRWWKTFYVWIPWQQGHTGWNKSVFSFGLCTWKALLLLLRTLY